MQSNSNLIKLSENTIKSNDSVIVMGGCGSLQVHPDIVKFLEKQGLEVYNHNRNADILLGENNNAIIDYLQQVRNSINILVEKGKRVHIYANSFGGYLALKITGEKNNSITSVVAIAPIIDPIKSVSRVKSDKQDDSNLWIKLPNGKDLPILNNNIKFLANNQVKIVLPSGLIIIGNKDEIIDSREIETLEGYDCKKHIIDGVGHGGISTDQKVRILMEEFYSKIIKKEQ